MNIHKIKWTTPPKINISPDRTPSRIMGMRMLTTAILRTRCIIIQRLVVHLCSRQDSAILKLSSSRRRVRPTEHSSLLQLCHLITSNPATTILGSNRRRHRWPEPRLINLASTAPVQAIPISKTTDSSLASETTSPHYKIISCFVNRCPLCSPNVNRFL